MASNMNLWGLTLLPGEKYPLYVRNSFTITNAALAEDLRSKDGRSVVKVTHQPLPPHFGDDSDSEIDSDIDIDDDVDEDEFELDQTEGFKLAKGANGDAEMDDEEDELDEDEDDDEDDEEDDDFSDDEEPEETHVITSLTAGRVEQSQLQLTFVRGEAVLFEVTGDNAVHLMGNYIYQPDLEDSDDEDESEFDSEADDYDIYGGSDLDEEDDEEAPAGKITELVESAAPKKAEKPKAKAAEASKPAAPAADKKRKAEAIDSPAGKSADAATEALSKNAQKKLAKKAKRDSEGGASAVAASPVQEKKAEKAAPKQKKLPSGLIIEDAKVGTGPVAKPGKRLSMRYIGKLDNGKQFDANTGGSPFSFLLGRGEVIKGWDEGLVGMAVGGERKLTIPSNLAYGNQKIPGIPKGSTLNFEVKLLAIK